MAEFKLGRIRFIWKGAWVAATEYFKDDIIRNGGKTYVCVVGHTAAADFYTDLDNIPTRWSQVSDGTDWKNNWTTGTFYKLNDIVKYGGLLYICTDSHTSAVTATLGLETDQAKWDVYAESFDWKSDWTTSTRYKVNDLVKYGGNTYVCNASHTSTGTVTLTITGASGTGSVATLTFAAQVVAPYTVGASITVAGMNPAGYNGTVTVTDVSTTTVSFANATTGFVAGGTVVGSSNLGLEQDLPKWDIYAETFNWLTDWTVSTRYKINDVVKYGGTLYICNSGHYSATTSTLGLEADQPKWDYLHNGIAYKNTWSASSVRYKINDVVKYGAGLWICTTYHTSSASFDETKWSQFVEGLEFEDSWNESAVYQHGDVVTYGGYAYIAITNNTNATPSTSTSDWSLFTTGFKMQSEWSSIDSYEVGNVVRNGGFTYVAILDNTNQTPPNTTYWSRLNSGIRWRNAWTSTSNYVQGDSVKYGVNSYICIFEHLSATINRPDNDTIGTYWNLLSGGAEESNLTTQGDLVYYGGAGPTRLPVGASGQVLKVQSSAPYWDYFGRIDDAYYVATTGVDLPAPAYGVTLDKPWATILYAAQQIEKGVKNPNAAYLLEVNRQYVQKEVTAWISAQVAGNISPFTTGFTYDSAKCERDIGYIIDALLWDLRHGGNARSRAAALSYVNDAPAVYSLGQKEETVASINQASTIIDAVLSNLAFTSLQGTVAQIINAEYLEESTAQSAINTLVIIMTDAITAGVATNIPAEIKPNATINVKTGTFYEVLPISIPAETAVVGDELRSTNIRPAGSLVSAGDTAKTLAAMTRLKAVIGDIVQGVSVTKTPSNTKSQTIVTPYGSVGAGTAVQALAQNAYDQIDKGVNGAGSYPALTGSNTPTATPALYDAARLLELNKEFLAEELTAYITTTYPAYTYDIAACKRDTREYIDAFKYDLVYTGNYATITAATLYINAVNGSTAQNMFYLRNGTGLRNCTVQGLTGTLSAANSYGTRRPTAGAYVSLDPGWGTADTKVWITRRSPYVQNVTTFGTGCVGMKVDGALHAGGNDSIVANDFTQVLSDGIGAWITNVGRAELVSVFSYYAHIAYLSENGGIIRATNGNNSYGDFGSVAEGTDSLEVPITGVVDNRANRAFITNVPTDGNRLLALEYANAGQNYTSATIDISGAGTSTAVAIADEFRDNAVFEVRLTDPGDSTGTGGTNYMTASNVAQTGTATSITIAATDDNLSTAYTGMRIIIVSGTGTGQYGYIQSYNSGTKIASVYKESTSLAGWDHLIAGTPISSTLDVSTEYVIEPRLTFSAPSYTASPRTQESQAWTDVVYGITASTHTTVAATGGAGTLATFNVTRSGLDYTVTLAAGGTSYVLGNTLTIAGADVGGATTANNITITVTKVNSGTGAVELFEYTGTGIGGRYVAVASGTNVTQYSTNGTTWTAGGNMPTSGTWTAVAYGNNRFVAVRSGSTEAAYSADGSSWASAASPLTNANWSAISYGNGRYVAVANAGNAMYSADGSAWTVASMPSTAAWTGIAYGNGRWVAIASGGTTAAFSTNNGIIWANSTLGLPSSGTWSSIAFGNGRFVAVASGGTAAAYSFDGNTWYASTLPASLTWSQIRYGQGVFFAVASGSTAGAATSPDGVTWTSRSLSAISSWTAVALGNVNRNPLWVALTASTTTANSIVTGATTFARAAVATEIITGIRLIEPGSGYISAPTMTITDPNNIGADATFTVRTASGVLAQPTWTNRGVGYLAAGASILSGNGFADIYQVGAYVNVKRLTARPVAGANIRLGGIGDLWYKLVNVTNLTGTGPFSATLQLSPLLGVAEAVEHLASATVTSKYSQVRLTGHDFLNIGTGNFTNTNYPGTPLTAPIPANETVESAGGRVFYTSTDQDGNFRVGALFTVEQSTGVATLNADAFNLAGLQELTLGAVALGGSGATITEFSTDPYFTADSDSILPTQRAIRAFISAQIGSGASSLVVNTLQAGDIYIAGNQISNINNTQITVSAKMTFTRGVDGSPLALNFFMR
jgi:hypothetical protein